MRELFILSSIPLSRPVSCEMEQGNHRSCRAADLHSACQHKVMSSALTATA